MGKKKDKHGRKHGHDRHDEGHEGAGAHRGPIPAPLAGFAAMAAAQLTSPVGRQMLATGLRAAADALTRREQPPAPPVPPRTPVPPPAPPAVPPAATGDAAGPPRDDRQALPPEIARVVDSIASGVERWAARLGQPKP